MNSPLRYYGGKHYMRNKILLCFPKNYNIYVEVFGGSGTVLFGKKETPVEIYNDLGGNVHNFFKVLSDDDLFRKLKHKLDLTYYSSDIRKECIDKMKGKLTPVEKGHTVFLLLIECHIMVRVAFLGKQL